MGGRAVMHYVRACVEAPGFHVPLLLLGKHQDPKSTLIRALARSVWAWEEEQKALREAGDRGAMRTMVRRKSVINRHTAVEGVIGILGNAIKRNRSLAPSPAVSAGGSSALFSGTSSAGSATSNTSVKGAGGGKLAGKEPTNSKGGRPPQREAKSRQTANLLKPPSAGASPVAASPSPAPTPGAAGARRQASASPAQEPEPAAHGHPSVLSLFRQAGHRVIGALPPSNRFKLQVHDFEWTPPGQERSHFSIVSVSDAARLRVCGPLVYPRKAIFLFTYSAEGDLSAADVLADLDDLQRRNPKAVCVGVVVHNSLDTAGAKARVAFVSKAFRQWTRDFCKSSGEEDMLEVRARPQPHGTRSARRSVTPSHAQIGNGCEPLLFDLGDPGAVPVLRPPTDPPVGPTGHGAHPPPSQHSCS